MLGTTRLETLFGAARQGFNTAGVNSLSSLLKAYSDDGIAVMFIAPGNKRPKDFRTEAMIKKMTAEWHAAGNEGEPPEGFYLATDDHGTLKKYLKEARKQYNSYDPNDPTSPDIATARYGHPPLNFGLVPDRSRTVVVDCDTFLEVEAFRNFFMDHTDDQQLRFNLDRTMPSVTSPGTIEGGHWRVAQEGYVYDDYGQDAWVPPVYENVGGQTAHAGGGHWYFFYPDGYELPDNAKTKIVVHYDAASRKPLLDEIRAAQDAIANAVDQISYDAAQARFSKAQHALDERRRWALETYRNNGFEPSPDQQLTVGKFDIMLKNCYVVIPPSSRYEGYYEVVSGDFAWEPWLENTINGNLSAYEVVHPSIVPSPATAADSVDGYAAVTALSSKSLNDVIEPWAQMTSWESILRPEDGWIRQVNDRCGCPIFTAPGKHSSLKSVTAHDGGCQLPGGCSELGRLHFWTTNPPEEFVPKMRGGKTDFTKLSALAITQFGGVTGKAMEYVGINLPAFQGKYTNDVDFNDFALQILDKGLNGEEENVKEILTLEPFDVVIKEPPPQYIVADTFESDSFNAMIGPSGSGKSFVAIDLAAALVTGGTWMGKRCRTMKVAYFAGEGRRGVVDRFRAWQDVREDDTLLMGNKMFFANYLPNLSMYSVEEYSALAERIVNIGAEFVIIDTWSRANAGADENAAETTSQTIDSLNGLQRKVREAYTRQAEQEKPKKGQSSRVKTCTILVIHHTRKDSDSARGSSAFNAALDTEILIKAAEDPDTRAGRRLIQVEVSKQKNSEPWPEPLYCQISKVGDDVVTLDEDNFPHTVKAPASIADLDGNFPLPFSSMSPDVAGMFGYNFTLTEPEREYASVERKMVYELVERVITTSGNMTHSELKKFVVGLISEELHMSLSTSAHLEVYSAIDDCARHGMLRAEGTRYYLNKTSLRKTAAEVYDIVTGEGE